MSDNKIDRRCRQKSCLACADGKRRCDRQTPRCSRCVNANVSCVYVSGRRQVQCWNEKRPQPINSNASDNFNDLSPISPPVEPLAFPPLCIDPWLTISPCLLTFPSTSDTSYPDIVFLDRWAVNQLVRNIKGYPRQFSRFQETHFIHPRLYEAHLPDIIQDAFTVSAAYFAKSTETEDMVYRILESKTEKLVQQSFESRSLEELLAAIHALMLFHIIQIFDGEIRQRTIAEQNFPTLDYWTMQLRVRVADLALAATWQDWIFAESVRRTVLLSTMLNSIYSVLKFGYCPNVPALSALPVTARASLWDARTGAAWLAELNGGSFHTLLYGDFAKAWESGQIATNLDTFQKLLLTPCLGEGYREMLQLEE